MLQETVHVHHCGPVRRVQSVSNDWKKSYAKSTPEHRSFIFQLSAHRCVQMVELARVLERAHAHHNGRVRAVPRVSQIAGSCVAMKRYVVLAVCSPSCANGGTCTNPNVCSCVSGWSGATCGTCKFCWILHIEENLDANVLSFHLVVCTSSCQNGGTCTGPNTCTCVSGWNGAVCQNCMFFSHPVL